jgi:methionyl-tRNA formyltransferase
VKIVLITQGLSRILLPLINSEHDVVGIIESMPRNFTENKKDSLLFGFLKKIYSLFNKKHQTLKSFCKERDIKYTHICKGRDREVEQWVKSIEPDLIVVFSMSQLLKESVFGQAKYGAINIHPSYLPDYRGPNPDFWQYYNMEMNPGVTVHYIDKGEDTGDIIYQKKVYIPLGTKSPERLDKLIGEVGVSLILKSINAIEKGLAPRETQSSVSPTARSRSLAAEEHITIIDWANWPVEHIWHVLRGTELWLNAFSQPSGIYSGQRWKIGGFVKIQHTHKPGELITLRGKDCVATKEGVIYLTKQFNLTRLVVNLLRP